MLAVVAVARVGEAVQGAADDVCDPVGGDAGGGVAAALVFEVLSETGVGRLDREEDLGGGRK